MLDINVEWDTEWDTTVYMFEKPHYWSLVFFTQDDGVGSYVWVCNPFVNQSVLAFISEDLH